MPYDDKSTLHKYNGVYYLSAGSYYATSSGGPYGPFTFRGNANPHTGPSGAKNATRSFGDTSQGTWAVLYVARAVVSRVVRVCGPK